MANVAELVEQVADQLQYAPDLLAYERDIRKILTEVYRNLCTERPWPFLLTREPFPVFPDITIGNAGFTWVGPRTFSFDATDWLEGVMYSEEHADAYEVFQQFLAGAELDLADPDLTGAAGNWATGPFVIENVLCDNTTLTIFCEQRLETTSIPAGLGDFVIRFKRYRLPARVETLLSIIDDQHRPLSAVPQNLWRQYQADPDTVGGSGPTYILPDGGFDSRYPTTLSNPTSVFEAFTATDEEVRQVRNRPIYQDTPFVATANTGGIGTPLLASTVYRFFICWTYSGRFGPPSKIVSVTTGATTPSVDLTAIPVAETGAGTDSFGDSGRRIAIFVSEGDHGPFFLANVQLNAFDTTYSLVTRVTTSGAGAPPRLRRWDAVYPGGPYQYVRIWPRPDTSRMYQIEYLRKPLALISDVDEPELPEAFHRLLVHRTVIEMGSRFNAGLHIMAAQERLANKHLQALFNRFLPQMQTWKQKGLLGATAGTGPIHPTSINVES